MQPRQSTDLPLALIMAREVRSGRGDEHSPSAIHTASEGDNELFRHAMREAGYIIPTTTMRAPRVCEICGHEFGESVTSRSDG